MKTELTKRIEKALYSEFEHLGSHIVFECQIGFLYGSGERVDAILYRTYEKDITCFEIKISVSDFHSKAKLSFIGNRNYYVLTEELYEKVKEEIPKEIGVYVANDFKDVTSIRLVKSCKKQELHYDKEIILASMIRSKGNKTNLSLMTKEKTCRV